MFDFETLNRRGDLVFVRPLDAGDEATVQAVFDGLSPESRRGRFLRSVPRLSSKMRTHLSAVDQDTHRAAVAWMNGAPAAVVRPVADGTGAYELAVAVVDRRQGCGLGRLLVESALSHAESSWIGEIRVHVGGTNRRSLALFSSLGFELRRDGIDLEGTRRLRISEIAA